MERTRLHLTVASARYYNLGTLLGFITGGYLRKGLMMCRKCTD